MKKTYQECLQIIKSEHKDLYPIWYIEHGGKYIFNMLKRGVNREDAVSNFYAVDPSNGESIGPIPVMTLYEDDSLVDKLDNPNKIVAEDQQLEHAFLKNEQTMYRVRKSDQGNVDEEIVYGGYLSHHGIQGQKWGHRNGPPYPLKPEMHSKAEKTAANRKANSSNNADKSRHVSENHAAIIGSNKNSNSGLVAKSREKKAESGSKWLDSMDVDLSKFINRDESKKNSLDASLVDDAVNVIFNPTHLITVGLKAGMSAVANAKTKKYFKKREAECEKDPKTGLYLKSEGKDDDKSDLAAVNPGVMNMNSNTKNNCMLCTTTYDLRKRGYDVTAQLDSQGYNVHDLKKWYPKAKTERNDRYGEDGRALKQSEYVQKSINNILKQGDGARGNIMVQFKGGGGHSIVYEVQNGRVIFKDGQINKVYKNPEKFLSRTNVNAFTRLDNVEPNFDEIKKYCVR